MNDNQKMFFGLFCIVAAIFGFAYMEHNSQFISAEEVTKRVEACRDMKGEPKVLRRSYGSDMGRTTDVHCYGLTLQEPPNVTDQ